MTTSVTPPGEPPAPPAGVDVSPGPDPARTSLLDVVGPPDPVRVGVIVPHDMALDGELWRWTPDGVVLHFTRVPYVPLPVTLESAILVGDEVAVGHCVQDLMTVSPSVYAYACTSGSFAKGILGEQGLVESMEAAGAVLAVTTSGALLMAVEHLGIGRVSIATPYDEVITSRLTEFLTEAGVSVVGSSCLDLHATIWKVGYERTAQLVLDADSPDTDAVIVSCTNLPTYDLIAPLEQMLGKPVITANQVTMWAALRVLGQQPVGPGQRLIAL
ncbi:MAG: maleate cis-trans isomerase family protein [Nocardioidaceae bacterium]